MRSQLNMEELTKSKYVVRSLSSVSICGVGSLILIEPHTNQNHVLD